MTNYVDMNYCSKCGDSLLDHKGYKTMIKLDKFEIAFFACALWSSVDIINGEDVPFELDYNIADIDDETILKLKKDCESFREDNAELLEQAGDDEQNGHDFWLTRNGHGAGFWDRSYGDVGKKLTEACKVYGSVDLCVGDDGKIYC